jgi:hypothetical protein
MHRCALALIVSLGVLSFLPGPARAQSLDQYGGYTALPVPGGPTGFFRLGKIGNRWVFATPEGNAFWYRGVQHATESWLVDGVISSKYGGDAEQWGTHRNQRLLAWGFNAIGQGTSTRGLPIPSRSSSTGSSVKLPFTLFMTTIQEAMLSPTSLSYIGLPDYLKDCLKGVPTTVYSGWRASVIPDVYSPLYQQALQGEFNYWKGAIPGLVSSPWVIGISTDDADWLWGFKGRSGAVVQPYPNPAWLIAMAKFQYTSAERPGGGNWLDPKLYTKYAWVDFLRARYTTVGALNMAWGTGGFYTSFDDAGGWGTGTGVIDEDGRHTAWVGKMSMSDYSISGANATFMQDVNDFLYQFAKTYASTAVTTIRALDPNHLIFGPNSINNYGTKAFDQVLRGLADGGFDALQLNYDPRVDFATMAGNNATYDLVGKPAFLWYSVTANADSDMSATSPGPIVPNFATQAIRGQHYASDLAAFLGAQGSNGDYYIVGLDWWELVDNPSEGINWGLLSRLDNAYDGIEAVIALGTDPWGYPRGGELRQYGNFLSSVTTANTRIYQVLRRPPPTQ